MLFSCCTVTIIIPARRVAYWLHFSLGFMRNLLECFKKEIGNSIDSKCCFVFQASIFKSVHTKLHCICKLNLFTGLTPLLITV